LIYFKVLILTIFLKVNYVKYTLLLSTQQINQVSYLQACSVEQISSQHLKLNKLIFFISRFTVLTPR